jgi:hypothetical protein
VVGHRIDERVKVNPKTTRLLRLEFRLTLPAGGATV